MIRKELIAKLEDHSLTPVSDDADTIIYCWPYSAAGEGNKQGRNDPVTSTVALFAVAWLLATLFQLGLSRLLTNNFMFWKVVPFLVIPIMAWSKGITHLRINSEGISFESSSGRSRLGSKDVPWFKIKNIYVIVPKKRRNPLVGDLFIEEHSGRKHKVPLKKIASAEQWRNLVGALQHFAKMHPSVHTDLNPALLDALASPSTKDPSYTKLWLEALTAPPRRERLQPLTAGAALNNGQYVITKLLGSGGQGSAYLARRQWIAEQEGDAGKERSADTPSVVVLKEYILPVYVDVKVRRKALEDFEREGSMLRSFKHPGIVECFAYFIEDHRAYLVLEYIPGLSLRQLVSEKGALPETECIRYGKEMCEMLIYLHEQSPPVVHQDFAPDNLICDAAGKLKLIDFMMAKREMSESVTSTVVGKHHFMPPEQFRGRAVPASDIYALGGTLYFLLTGKDPEPLSVSHPTLENENVSGGLTSIVERATMLDLSKRYSTAAELLQHLQQLA